MRFTCALRMPALKPAQAHAQRLGLAARDTHAGRDRHIIAGIEVRLSGDLGKLLPGLRDGEHCIRGGIGPGTIIWNVCPAAPTAW
ncbi:MAG: hypothetical protein ACREUR_09615 [Nitrosospira sp.]